MLIRFKHGDSGFKLLRWLTIVALSCLISFVLTLFIIYLRPAVRRPVFGEVIITGPDRSESDFKPTTAALEKELQKVISSQLSAFRQDDYQQAYSFAAATVKANINLPAFEKMVRVAYPVIAQSKSADFGETFDDGRIAIVKVTILGNDGESRHYSYFLQHEDAGWKISGVKEDKPPGILI